MGFPKSICFSTNEVLLHGIPRDDEVVEGDIVSIDISLFTHLGTHGDNCGTFLVVNVLISLVTVKRIICQCGAIVICFNKATTQYSSTQITLIKALQDLFHRITSSLRTSNTLK